MQIHNLDNVVAKVEGFFDGMSKDLHRVGTAAATQIVATTLEGQGVDDSAFVAYSESYLKQLRAAGGKPSGNVDLRGVLERDGIARHPASARNRSKKNQPKRPRTGSTVHIRGPGGLTDTNSEMSLDLIKVDASEQDVALTYEPRKNDYMIGHNEGSGSAPQRKWFTLKKSAVRKAIVAVLGERLAARVARFNAG